MRPAKPVRTARHTLPAQLCLTQSRIQVALFKPPDPAALESGQPRTGRLGGDGGGTPSAGSSQSDEPFLTVQDVMPSKATAEWWVVGGGWSLFLHACVTAC